MTGCRPPDPKVKTCSQPVSLCLEQITGVQKLHDCSSGSRASRIPALTLFFNAPTVHYALQANTAVCVLRVHLPDNIMIGGVAAGKAYDGQSFKRV